MWITVTEDEKYQNRVSQCGTLIGSSMSTMIAERFPHLALVAVLQRLKPEAGSRRSIVARQEEVRQNCVRVGKGRVELWLGRMWQGDGRKYLGGMIIFACLCTQGCSLLPCP